MSKAPRLPDRDGPDDDRKELRVNERSTCLVMQDRDNPAAFIISDTYKVAQL